MMISNWDKRPCETQDTCILCASCTQHTTTFLPRGPNCKSNKLFDKYVMQVNHLTAIPNISHKVSAELSNGLTTLPAAKYCPPPMYMLTWK